MERADEPKAARVRRGMEMSLRRAASQIARGVGGSRRIAARRAPQRTGRGKTIPKKVKRLAEQAERARTPDVQLASSFDWKMWSGYVLLVYTIAWFAFVSSFIAG